MIAFNPESRSGALEPWCKRSGFTQNIISWIPWKYNYALSPAVPAAVSNARVLEGLPSGARMPKAS
jgi:hypothetical protein